MSLETTGNGSCRCYTQAELEDMFQNRYKDADEEFMKTVNTPLPPPPCVPNWYSRPKRIYDWSNRGGGEDRGRGRGRGRGGYNRYHDRDGPSRVHYPGMRQDQQYSRDGGYRDRGGSHHHQGYGPSRTHYSQRDDQQNRYHPYGQGRPDNRPYPGSRYQQQDDRRYDRHQGHRSNYEEQNR